ncbi:hypothetical protein CABS03_12727 [Colletotrichum abscissum]|uniref:Polyketide synthase n=1 Tax=Colletotrichum abscissum TaxID=1671311 RepID=A0A9P9XGH8_9PEZI|nr:hypothetical protein CABS02_06500 [Colletotrichum abscissum]
MQSIGSPIAIIGVGCRLPGGASDLEKLWQLLSEGRSGRTKIPKDRWHADEWFDPYPEAKQSVVTKHGFFVQDDISLFDAKFFGISSTEAHSMDPQQRLFLMTTYEALEDACIPIDSLRGSNTGVYASIFERSYDRMGHKDPSTISRTHLNGTGESILSNRVSYCFDLKGPCMTIDTGCSGSLVALHQACQSLKLGETDLALVGSSQLVIHPDVLAIMSGMGMLNPDGKSYAFDSRGDGYGRGEGVATIDGKTSGLNTPSGDAQASLSSRVYREAGLNPADTAYVEAHGTGTQVGDREEIASISKVFCEDVGRQDDLYVGSVKTNVGHLEAASGMAGLLKSILILKHGKIPPNLDFIKPKPSLKLYEKKITIPTELTPLPSPRNGAPARVSLNSFGYGGTNCHVILEAAESKSKPNGVSQKPNGVTGNGTTSNGPNGVATNGKTSNHNHESEAPNSPQLFLLSASTEKALSTRAQDLVQWLKTHDLGPRTLRSLSYTLALHKSALSCRKAIVASNPEQLTAELEAPMPEKKIKPSAPITFVFSGQGAQWHAMGLELARSSYVFKQSMSAMDETLRSQGCRWSLLEELSRPSNTSRVGEAELAQPCTTAIQIALVDLLESLAIRPSRVVGHSSGEIAAAYASGALSRDGALLLAYHRGLTSAKAKQMADTGGAMMAVNLSESQAVQYLKRATSGKVVVACVNSPTSLTLSGDEGAVDEIKSALDQEGIFARKLKVDTAYHSHHMQRVADHYQQAIGEIRSGQVRDGVVFYSSVTGAVKTTDFGASYWTSNLVSQVKFSQALILLRNDQSKQETNMDVSVFVEIGPHSALAGPCRQTLTHEGTTADKFKFEYLSVLSRNIDAVQTTLTFLGRAFEIGLGIDMVAVLSVIDNAAKPDVVRDLKPYPWDLVPFWRESRLSKTHRFRQFPHHDLLGLLDPTSTIHEPRWRYFLNLDALPWLRDHVVEGFMIYPGAGYLTMAMEAMKQLSEMRGISKPIAKFVLRDVDIPKAIVLSEPEDGSTSEVEVQLSMSAVQQHETSGWQSFRVWSYGKDDTWTEHCVGEIMIVYEKEEHDDVEGTREVDLLQQEALDFLNTAKQDCDTDMTKSDFYGFASLSGNEFRGAFASIVSARHGNRRGVFEICTPDIASVMPHRFFRPHFIHPTTLDAAQQINGILFKKFISNATCVPTKLPFLEISGKMSTKAGDSLTGAMQIEADGPQTSKGAGWVFQKDADGHLTPVIRLAINLRAISEAHIDEDRPFVQDKVNRLDWNFDVDFLTGSSFLYVLSSTLGLDENTTYGYHGTKVSVEEARHGYLTADRASTIWIREAVRRVETADAGTVPSQLVKFFEWMKKWLASEYCREIMMDINSEDESRTLHDVESSTSSAELQLLARVGKALPGIVSGAVEPLDVMLEDNLLSKNYESGTFTGDYQAAVAYLRLLTFKNPRLRVIEIGAGTGGCTKWLFDGLSGQNGAVGLPVDKYTFTDISSGFFEEARETFAQWEDVIEFRTLDADADPVEQGFESESYDVVVAANVLHATRKIDLTTSRVRKLLKPGGSLVLLEISPRGAAVGLVAGTLTGWWAHEDEFRVDTPLLHREQWAEVLSRNGFGGIHLARGCMMVAKAVPSTPNGALARHDAILLENCADDRLDSIVKGFASHAIDIVERGWDQVDVEKDSESPYLVLDSAVQPLLLEPSPQLFKSINTLLAAKRRVLWVVVQDKADPAVSAYIGVVNTLIRVLRRESGNNGLITLDVRYPIPCPDETARLIADVAQRCFWPPVETQKSLEPEFAYENGRVLIPRVKPDAEFLRWARSGTTPDAVVEPVTIPYQGDRVLKAEFATPGLLSSLRFVDHIDDSHNLPQTQIVVEAQAHGINYKDVCVALGQLSPGTQMVGEFAGIVTAVSEDMLDVHKVGDRVMGFGAQPFSNLPVAHGFLAHKIPDWMSSTTAASLPHAFATAYHCVTNIARLKSGQSILIHGASGAVGQAAIQLAQHLGATAFCSVSTAAKKQLLVHEYGIPDSHIFSSHAGSFKQGIMRLTHGEGVDLILNSSTGESLRDSVDCVKRLGTFVELSRSAIQQGSLLNMTAFSRSITFVAFDMTTVSAQEPETIHRVLGDVVNLFERKVLRPIQPITIYPIDQIDEAFRFLSSRKHTGKVVLTIEPSSRVNGLPPKPLPLQLRQDGTYVVAGGLGDLPSRICIFLAARGAGHIVSLSRRSIDDETREKYTTAVQKHGGELHILQCDITNDESMARAASYCSALPPVRGVVHGAMILKDRTFSQMTVEEWSKPLLPKVFGTINLDKSFASPDLSFFITLSSIVAVVGKSGQSNYAAGNGFQDAFAHAHANHPHTHYVSVNIGVVSVDAHGALKESEKGDTSISSMRAGLRQNSVMDISFDEFFADIEYAMTHLARESKLHQTIQGVTHQSMLDVNDEHLLDNPVFSQLTRTQEKQATGTARADKIDFGKALGSVKTMAEAETLIRNATLTKFAVFLDRPIDDIKVDQSLSSIGLDSLVSIELKNWMVRTFQVNLQTSELGGGGSIMALTAIVASRSKLIPEEMRRMSLAKSDELSLHTSPTIELESNKETGHGFYCCRSVKELPRYPLVDLDEAVEDLLNNIGHFSLNREEYSELSRKAHALVGPNSIGRKLYNQLRIKAEDPTVESWIAEPLLKALHIKRRYPLAPYSNFLGTHFDSTTTHSQAERAAALTRAVCEFKRDRDNGNLEPDYLGEKANCGNSLLWLFNALREPNLGCDKMLKYPGNEYVAVLRRGHLFKVVLQQGDDIVSYQHLRAVFGAILGLTLEEKRWTGMLTTDNRDEWATNRRELLSYDERNTSYLDTIEKSVFVLCLDDSTPVTREERIRYGYLGDSFNRWHDKSFQILVTANGRSGSIFEHSMIDFMTISQLSKRLQNAIDTLGHDDDDMDQRSQGIHTASLEEIPLFTTAEIEGQIETLREKYSAVTSVKQYTPHLITSFGKSIFLEHSAPIKATVDLTIQLASRLYFGYLPASWETVSTAHFHLGRPEIVQVVLKSVVEFCDAALDSTVPRAEARNKLLQAARECNAQIVKGSEGRNYFRLMDVLEMMSEEQEPNDVPELFSDPVWKRSGPRLIMQTMIETKLAEDPGYTMEDPDNVWMNYTVNDDSVEVCFVSPRKGAERFQAALDRASDIVKSIIQAR